MFSVFTQLVKRIGIFMMIGQTVLNFGISKKYEKYLKLVISFMAAAQIIFAFGTYFKQENSRWQLWSAEEYLREWNRNMEELEERMEEGKEEMAAKIEKGIKTSGEYMEQNEMISEYHIKIEKITIP